MSAEEKEKKKEYEENCYKDLSDNERLGEYGKKPVWKMESKIKIYVLICIERIKNIR